MVLKSFSGGTFNCAFRKPFYTENGIKRMDLTIRLSDVFKLEPESEKTFLKP